MMAAGVIGMAAAPAHLRELRGKHAQVTPDARMKRLEIWGVDTEPAVESHGVGDLEPLQ